MSKSRYLSASEAANELGVTLATLYSYVSRGLIQSEASEDGKRKRRYNRQDVQRLRDRKDQRRDPAKAAEGALRWGAPVLPSALTLIADGKLYYRGYDALELAANNTFEQVAALLWTRDLQADLDNLFSRTRVIDADQYQRLYYQPVRDSAQLEAFQVALSLAAAEDPVAYDFRPGPVAQTGALVLWLLTLVAARCDKPADWRDGSGIAQLLQHSWTLTHPQAAMLLNTALILCADHELNVSSFTARCVASAGSTPYAAVTAGLAALQGTKHGGHTQRVEALFHEVGTPDNAGRVIASRLKRGEAVPGFGHRLYPEGDPRGRQILYLLEEVLPDAQPVALAKAICAEVFQLIGEYPTLDLGLVVLAQALNLNPGYAMSLFALGRTVGWIAHAGEQYQLNQLIRPRARYIGPLPSDLPGVN